MHEISNMQTETVQEMIWYKENTTLPDQDNQKHKLLREAKSSGQRTDRKLLRRPGGRQSCASRTHLLPQLGTESSIPGTPHFHADSSPLAKGGSCPLLHWQLLPLGGNNLQLLPWVQYLQQKCSDTAKKISLTWCDRISAPFPNI